MTLKSVHVRNFKCIEDSGEFSINRVTCLVGKNESGKTAILQALYKLNPVIKEDGDFDGVIEYPRRHWSSYKERCQADADNVLTTIWNLDQSDSEVLKEILGPSAESIKTVTLTKGYDNDLHWNIEIDEKQVVEHYLRSYGLWQDNNIELTEMQTIAQLKNWLKHTKPLSDLQSTLAATLQKKFPDDDAVSAVVDSLQERLPRFLYYSNYQKMPGQVSIDDLLRRKGQNQLRFEDRVFMAFLDLAGTNLEEIHSVGKSEELIAELEAVSNRISETIFKYWSQNRHLEVECRFDAGRAKDPPPFNSGYVFRIRIRNTRHRVTVSFDERSSGFVWFFSFLVWFSQVSKNYGKNLIILLDEPALNLHARAQGDWLRYIKEELSPYHQVIYTTHSPFMIDPENLLNVRTVEDVVIDDKIEGTKVGDEVLSTDADTLFPLQAALGYDITQTLFVGQHTLLVEGPSDFLYLKWFSNELRSRGRAHLDPRWVITPCGGIDKVGSFLALFAGNKLDIAIFTDFHAGEKRKVRTLRESNLLKQSHVFSAEMYVEQDEADIEDLLGRPLYVTLVNRCFNLAEPYKLPDQKPLNAPARVISEVEQHFQSLPSDLPEFDHYKPATFLMENSGELRGTLPGIEEALNRFERLFKDLNSLLPK